MNRKLLGLAFPIAMLAASAAAQTTVTTSGGTTNTVPVFTGTSTVGNSPISVSGSNVGISTTSPNYPLDLSGDAHINSGNIIFSTSSSDLGGNTGIQANPNGWTRIDPNGSRFLMPVPASRVATADNILDIERTDTWQHLMELHADGSAFWLGNVGIGTTAPGADLASLSSPPASGTPILEVNGDIAMTQGSGGQMYFQDGTVQATAWTGALGGGDYAESVDISGDRKKYEPGDLLVVDKHDPSKFVKSSEPYSTLVAGIYSTKPGTVGRRQTTPKSADEIPMAVVGIVPAKVSAENGAIEAGDLLVSSSTPGVAMKGTDRNRMLGAIVGKAMGTLDSGTGAIEVLVTLQ